MKRFYWLKLPANFFTKHKVVMLESKQNGQQYVLFYLKMLCEAMNHEGKLRSSETKPYNVEELAYLFRTDIEIAEKAIERMIEVELLQVFEDGTFYLTELSEMIGSESGETEAIRKRNQRAKKTFTPPALEEVKQYIEETKANVDAQHFFDYYEGTGWKTVSDWKATIRRWHDKDKKKEAKMPSWYEERKQNGELGIKFEKSNEEDCEPSIFKLDLGESL